MGYKDKKTIEFEQKLQELTGYKEKDPAFLFYTNDFIIKTAGMSMEERGQIITILALQHSHGHLTEKMLKQTIPDLTEDVFNEFQLDDEGKLYSRKLDYVIAKRGKKVISCQENGKKGGRPKKNKEKPIGLPNENLPENENETETKKEAKRENVTINKNEAERKSSYIDNTPYSDKEIYLGGNRAFIKFSEGKIIYRNEEINIPLGFSYENIYQEEPETLKSLTLYLEGQFEQRCR